jgi:tetratricopeptide (TPR) repeat protein
MLKNLFVNPLTMFSTDEPFEKAYQEFIRDEFEKSLTSLDEILKKTPEHQKALMLTAEIHKKQEHYDKADEYFSKVLKLDADSDDARAGKAESLYFLAKYEAALDEYLTLFERHPLTSEWYIAVGATYGKLNLHILAKRYLERGLKLFPYVLKVFVAYAHEMADTEQWNKANEHIQKAKELYYQNKSAYDKKVLEDIEKLEDEVKEKMGK